MIITSWQEAPIYGFDVETTGLSLEEDRIISASLVLVGPDQKVLESNSWLINPGVRISPDSQSVHGISNQMIQESGENPSKAIPEIISLILNTKWPIAGFNIPFDLGMLLSEGNRLTENMYYQLRDSTMNGNISLLDPLVCDRHLDPYRRGGRSLEKVAEIYEIQLKNAHTAFADALAAAQIMFAIASKYELPNDPKVLHRSQIEWHRLWAERYEKHIQQNKESVPFIRGSWPL